MVGFGGYDRGSPFVPNPQLNEFTKKVEKIAEILEKNCNVVTLLAASLNKVAIYVSCA